MQLGFPELRPYHKQLELRSILDSFEKKTRKRINNGFGTEIKNIQFSNEPIGVRYLQAVLHHI